jgi:hypothetical protein
MQMTGYLIVKGQKILVLARQAKIYIAFKLRKSGQDGHHFQVEEEYLNEHADADWSKNAVTRLLKGEVIKL